MKTAFWISLAIIFYTFLGYGVVLYMLILIRRMVKGKRSVAEPDDPSLPSCTLIVAAYNEADFIHKKIQNTLSLHYPEGKLKLVFITDGSADRTPEIIAGYPEIQLMHETERKGKIVALHRAAASASTDIIVFTDANTLLNPQALVNIGRHYTDSAVGAVAGEKRIHIDRQSDAGTAGEGFYWKYESALKKWDSELYSVVGAAGELFSVRTELYKPVPDDTILDDFMISMLIAKQGYRIIYEPEAYAIETASEDVGQELKRKIRIAAGGIQSIVRLRSLLNIFRYGILSFQYISHRVLRWTITPILLISCFVLNILIVMDTAEPVYRMLLSAQVLFYLLAITGFMLEKRHLRIKALFIPFYFCMMNYAVLAGMKRYFTNQQSAIWEKAKRKN